jgi:small subunit ribosomal protein S8
MANTDPVADMLSRIRNAILVSKTSVEMPHSKMKETIARQLHVANFVDNVRVEGEGIVKKLIVDINKVGTNPRITLIEKVSKPGRRVYAKVEDIPTVKNGRGLVIVSTSQGVMSGFDAKKKKVGGELIAKVY